MKSQSARLAMIGNRTPLPRMLLAALLMAAAALLWRPAAAASGVFGDCDSLAADLRSLEVPDTELPLDDADHGDAIGDASAELVARDSEYLAPDPGAPPVLRLTPRVADIVRNVFDTLPVVAIDDGSDDPDAVDKAGVLPASEPATEMPPIVRAPSLPQVTLPGAPAAGAGEAPQYAPRLQTPMYRTDI